MITFDPATHRYEIDGQPVPSVTTVLKDMGFVNASYFTEYARTRGTLVHRIIQYHVEGTLDDDTIDPALMGYFNAWRRFEDETGFVSTDTEKPLASEVWRFAGTPDHIGCFPDLRSACIDVKSGAIFPATQIQVAAYEILAAQPLKRFALCLKEDGKYSLKQFTDRQDAQIFKAALACWWFQKNNKIR